jgi:hypothetical protein
MMMKKRLYIAPLLFCLCLAAAADAEKEDGFENIFNGRDLSGWEGKPGGWRVEDGAITGESTEAEPCRKHHYLFWAGARPADFILRFEYRITGGNSGLQFRSRKKADWDTWGYQADIEAGDQWSGCLFQHDRGGVVMRGYRAVIKPDGSREEEKFADPEKLQTHIHKGKWNRYEIEARGSKIRLSINGRRMCEADDRHETLACDKGWIALQMHPGPPMKVQFRNLRIKILDK